MTRRGASGGCRARRTPARTAWSAPLCRHAGSQPPGSRRPARAGTAARPGRSGAAPGQCPWRAGFHRQWTARPPGPAWSARREYAGIPAAGSLAPSGRPAGRCSEPSPGGRAGRLLGPYFLVASLRCLASRAAGVTGKISAQRRGMNRVSVVNRTRSAGSYRTRPAFTASARRRSGQVNNTIQFPGGSRSTLRVASCPIRPRAAGATPSSKIHHVRKQPRQADLPISTSAPAIADQSTGS